MSAWTEDRISRLKSLWRQGRSAAGIASDLGPPISRSAVLGKVRRLQLQRGRKTLPSVVAAHSPTLLAKGQAEASPSPDAAACRGDPAHPTDTILSVRRCQCRWPFGDPSSSDFRLCGAPVVRGAYCEAHAARAYHKRPVEVGALLRLAGVA